MTRRRYVAVAAAVSTGGCLGTGGDTSGNGTAHGHVTDPHRIPRVVDPDVETVRDAIDLTADRGGITSFVFHELDDSETVLADLVDHLTEREADGAVSIVTPADLAEECCYRPDQ
ncbi:hypothetical protein [Halosolutus halophilus]|uniref:hypothetical protein n=1 Tax=Halosolutus halophilus TaxID=1552990 RepID=UPI00223515BA|nr:hypothetical protein [Halosolutus halophilus]